MRDHMAQVGQRGAISLVLTTLTAGPVTLPGVDLVPLSVAFPRSVVFGPGNEIYKSIVLELFAGGRRLPRLVVRKSAPGHPSAAVRHHAPTRELLEVDVLDPSVSGACQQRHARSTRGEFERSHHGSSHGGPQAASDPLHHVVLGFPMRASSLHGQHEHRIAPQTHVDDRPPSKAQPDPHEGTGNKQDQKVGNDAHHSSNHSPPRIKIG